LAVVALTCAHFADILGTTGPEGTDGATYFFLSFLLFFSFFFFFFHFSNYSRMQVLEMTAWWILCGVMMVVGVLGAAVEGESREGDGGFWKYGIDFFLFLFSCSLG